MSRFHFLPITTPVLSFLGALSTVALLASGDVLAAREANIARSKHNLSASSNTTVQAVNTDEICVFCHTPHGANTGIGGPLWNRSQASGVTYTLYSSSSLDATLTAPDGSSKLCLTCHDGTVAIGSMMNKPGQDGYRSDQPVPMDGVAGDGTMPAGDGVATGFTRRLGTDLSNDHPISVTLDATLASLDGELVSPSNDNKQEVVLGNSTLIGKQGADGLKSKPILPLEPTGISGAGQMQCGTCHDPHIIDSDSSRTLGESIKFLRLNRFQTANPAAGFNQETDIICLACHDKAGWETSIHANSFDANEAYRAAAASQREFPDGVNDSGPIQVYQAACLNCHDTHTVAGSRRLLREGTDDGDTTYNPATGDIRTGGSAAIEQTCLQCHRPAGESILNITDNNRVPDIKTEFERTYRMPIETSEQGVDTNRPSVEPHDIGDVAWPANHPTDTTTKTNAQEHAGANFVESPTKLGWGATDSALINRHAECTDCHNPHRLQVGTHVDPNGDRTYSDDRRGDTDGNLISNVLLGTHGVEPVSWESSNTLLRTDTTDSSSFTMRPSDFQVLCGTATHGGNCDGEVTKEYQICLRCHSNYGYNDTGMPDGQVATGRPPLRYLPPAGTNQLQNYTNQAMEFQAADGHRGENGAAVQIDTTLDSGASNTVDPNNNNHRSWHPVMKSTGRTENVRWGGTNGSGGRWLAPWNQNVGNQTMYCSDCHNNGIGQGTTPSGVQGPHGSDNPKLLRDTWSTSSNNLCFDCHNSIYASSTADSNSGFQHGTHVDKALSMRCTQCHIVLPHGWKNKAFLANLRDIGPEVLCDGGAWCGGDNTKPVPEGSGWEPRYYTAPPYYLEALLDIFNFAPAGQWNEEGNCGHNSGNSGRTWMEPTCGG